MPTIRLDEEADRWRWTCPKGHRSWEPTNGHFWCQRCAQVARDHGDDDVDPVFYQLHDDASDETYSREEIDLMTPLGAYEGARSA
jgi:hypothetical protein